MKNRVGPKRRKGSSGMIGMGRGDLEQGGGNITRKPLPAKVIQEKKDEIRVKARSLESAQAGFAARARQAKPKKTQK